LDSFLFRARGTESQLSELKWAIAGVHGICLPVLLYFTDWKMLILYLGIFKDFIFGGMLALGLIWLLLDLLF